MALSYSEFVNLLPRQMRSRFDSIGAFVDAVVEARQENIPKEGRLKLQDLQTIKLAVFVYALQEFLREGTRAASRAVDEFQNLGVDGFNVGSTLFRGRNENVMRGLELADALQRTIDDPSVIEAIEQASRMSDLIIDLMRRRGR